MRFHFTHIACTPAFYNQLALHSSPSVHGSSYEEILYTDDLTLTRRSCCRQIIGGPPICTSQNLPQRIDIHLYSQVSNEFQANKEPTIGAAFLTQKCRLEDRVLRYEIWDTAGQERFHSLAVSRLVYTPGFTCGSILPVPQPMYYRNAQAAVVVYDVTKATSLEKAKSWVKELQRQANPNIVIALAGNKVDLIQSLASSPGAASSSESEEEADDATATPGETPGFSGGEPESLRQVPREEAQAYASEAGLLFFETSAKTGEGIVDIFTEIGKSFILHLNCFSKKIDLQQRRYPLNTFWLQREAPPDLVLAVELVPARRVV